MTSACPVCRSGINEDEDILRRPELHCKISKSKLYIQHDKPNACEKFKKLIMDSSDEDGEDWTQPVEKFSEIKGDNSCTISTFPSTQSPITSKDSSLFASKLGHSRTIVHIDMDCFYAQVEMLRNPELRNKPLGVQQKNIIVTCNYKAREFGVKKLTLVKDAKEKCPELVLVCGEDLTHYREYSYRISEFLQQYTPNVERLGFDENYLDVSDMVRQRISAGQNPPDVKGHVYIEKTEAPGVKCCCGCHERLTIGSQIAADIRQALFSEMGVTCCAGISYNKLLSKLIGSQHKPSQQTTLFPGEVSKYIGKMENVQNIPGIGHATSKRLAGMDVVSVLDLQNCDLADLKEEFGHTSAMTMKQLCLGIDDSPVITFGKPQSISDEDSFRNCCTKTDVRKKIQELLCSLGRRLLDDGRIPQTVRLTIRKLTAANKWTNRESKQCPVPAHCVSNLTVEKWKRMEEELADLLMNLFHKLVDTEQPFHITLMNIAFCSLTEKPKTSITSFFSPKTTKVLNNSKNESQESKNESERTHSSDLVTKSHNKGQGLLKWVSRSPSESCKTWQGKADRQVGDNSKTAAVQSSELRSMSTSKSAAVCEKRKRDGVDAVKDMQFIKKNKTGMESSTLDLSNSAGNMLPEGYDREVFLELPEDIQKELLQNAFSRSVDCCADKSDHLLVDRCKTRNTTSVDNRTQGVIESQDRNFPFQENSQKQKPWLPRNIDQDVFCNLPPDIQKEYMDQWEMEHCPGPVVTGIKPGVDSQVSPSNKVNKKIAKPAGLTSITNFFKTNSKKS